MIWFRMVIRISNFDQISQSNINLLNTNIFSWTNKGKSMVVFYIDKMMKDFYRNYCGIIASFYS